MFPVESHGLGLNDLHVMCLVYDRFVQYLFCPVDSLPGRGFFFPFIATHDSRNVCLQDNLGIYPFHENGGLGNSPQPDCRDFPQRIDDRFCFGRAGYRGIIAAIQKKLCLPRFDGFRLYKTKGAPGTFYISTLRIY